MKLGLQTVLVCAACAVLVAGCRKSDIRTVTIDVPGMQTAACADRVGAALRDVPGVRDSSITVDLAQRRVTLSYNSIALSLKNVEFAIAKAGFAANDVPADKKARAALPPECRSQ